MALTLKFLIIIIFKFEIIKSQIGPFKIIVQRLHIEQDSDTSQLFPLRIGWIDLHNLCAQHDAYTWTAS